MATARPEGCGLVPVASNQRNMDSRYYSPAQCVGQLAENSAAKGNKFNASTFEVSVLSEFDSYTRTKGTDHETRINTQALKALDDGLGFLYEEVEDMLTYGTPETLSTHKKFGKACLSAPCMVMHMQLNVNTAWPNTLLLERKLGVKMRSPAGANNHGLKAVAATLSPACCLLFSKSKRPDGESDPPYLVTLITVSDSCIFTVVTCLASLPGSHSLPFYSSSLLLYHCQPHVSAPSPYHHRPWFAPMQTRNTRNRKGQKAQQPCSSCLACRQHLAHLAGLWQQL